MTTIETDRYPAVFPRLEWYRGDTGRVPTLEITENGVPLDLSTWALTAQWREYPDSNRPVALSIDTSEANVGILKITAAPAVTATLAAEGFWDLQGVKAGDVCTFLTGPVTTTPDVTR